MKTTWIAMLTVAGMISMAHANGELKIATVDLQRALQTVEAGKKAKTQLEKDFNAKKKEIDAEEASLKKASEEFKKQSLVLSDDARAKKQQELQERFMKFQQSRGQAQGDLQQKESELTLPIIAKLKAATAELAKSKGYTHVFQRNEDIVIVSPDKDDLTTALIESFNKANK